MKGVSDNNAQNNKQIKGNKETLKKPLQVIHISKKDTVQEKDELKNEHDNTPEKLKSELNAKKPQLFQDKRTVEINNKKESINNVSSSYEDLNRPLNFLDESKEFPLERKVDEFDFDESAFLEALNANEPIGTTGETIKGKVIATESDGLYIDIAGKAPGFMPKKECGLGVITNFKERFPNGLEMEVLVIKEQNADGMVTVSARALILRQSWEKVSNSAKNGELIDVLINGFNRGGLTCDVDGLRGFIPRSQLEEGKDYQSLVG